MLNNLYQDDNFIYNQSSSILIPNTLPLNLNVKSDSYHKQLRFQQNTLPLVQPIYITHPAIDQTSRY